MVATEHMDVDLVYVADPENRPSEENHLTESRKVILDCFLDCVQALSAPI